MELQRLKNQGIIGASLLFNSFSKFNVRSSATFELNEFVEKFQAIKVPAGFEYNSATNEDWETIKSLQEKIAEHVHT